MNKKRQIYFRIIAVMAALIVAVLDLSFVIGRDRAYSPTENRNLQTLPAFDLSGALSGRWESRFESYVADQFPLRDRWIGVKSTVDRLMGRVEAGNVYLGGDGYLIRDFTEPDPSNYAETVRAMQAFAARHADLSQYALIAPSALTVMADKLPAFAPVGDESGYLDSLARDLSGTSIAVIDVREPLKALSRTAQAYYRTDHHWTTDGAYTAYLELARTASLSGAAAQYDRAMLTDSFSGTLTASSGFRMNETDPIYAYIPREEVGYVVEYVAEGTQSPSVYVADNLALRDKYTVFFGGNHAQIRIQTNAETDRRALIIKDSYANCLIPFLIPDYRELVVVDPRYFTGDLDMLIEVERVTDVIYIYNAGTMSTDTALKADLT